MRADSFVRQSGEAAGDVCNHATRRAKLLRQQRFAPERDESPGVEVFRMQRSQAHDGRMIRARRIVIENSFKRFGKSGI